MDALMRLKEIIQNVPTFLNEISEENLQHKSSPDKWSKKEVIGHLIDSALHNHQRFVKSQFEQIPAITYDQNNWVEYNYYQERPSEELILLWRAYNLNLLSLMKLIPVERLSAKVNNGSPQPVTIQYVIEDYVAHLEHHLRQIL